jgi:outer membrane receptor protein involved in Fe transport
MYRDDKEVNLQYLLQYPPPYPPSVTYIPYDHFADTSKSAAVYGEIGERFLNNQFQWSVGVRYFHDDEGTQALTPLPTPTFTSSVIKATSSATTPRLVLSWFPTRDVTGYLSYSQGFRSGVPQDELVGSVIPSYPALKPDKLSNYEVGLKGSLWDHRLTYETAVFYMKWKDIQQQVDVPAPPAGDVYVLLNGQSASGEGAEFSLKAEPWDGLSVGAVFGWNNLHFNSSVYSGGALLFAEGSRPNYSPEYTAGLSAQYKFALGGTGAKGLLSASGNYTSPLSQTYVATAGTGSFGGNSLLLVRARAGVEFSEHWLVSVFVDNLNNYNGSQLPTPGVPDLSTRVQPRTYGLQLDYHLR